MKRLIAVSILFLVIAAVCITGIVVINHTYKETSSRLENAAQEFQQGNYEKAAELAAELENEWIKSERILSLFVDHSSIDEIGISIARLEPAARNQNDIFLEECKLAKIQLLHIREDEKPDLLNIF